MNLKVIFFVVPIISFMSCSRAQGPTPKEYRNHTQISKEIYQKHIKALSDSLNSLIRNRQEPYYQQENDSLTQLFIDTIIYSPKIDKFAFFAITKNSNDKLLEKGEKDEFHYDAHCFIGTLNASKQIASIQWVKGYNLSDYKSLEKASNRIREIFFVEISQRRDKNNVSTYKYNFDDIRFWDGPLWNEYFH